MERTKLLLKTGVAAAVGVVIVIVFIFFMQRSSFGISMLQHFAPFTLPSSTLAQNLESKDNDLVRESLGILTDRRDPIGAQRALALLNSQDDYVWLNAALYLGALDRVEAVPYLIKALRHTAWRSDAEYVRDLQRMTGQGYPADFRAWSNWWTTANKDAAFDFGSYLGPLPRK